MVIPSGWACLCKYNRLTVPKHQQHIIYNDQIKKKNTFNAEKDIDREKGHSGHAVAA